MRIGIGYDIHPLKRGCKFLLGGVEIPYKKGFFGHSDGDVLFHAVVDALLGAAGLGDIGEHFSDKDSRWEGVSSSVFAEKTLTILKKNKFKILNVDAVVIAEEPKLSSHKNAIRRSVAKVLGLKEADVSVKAKTNERLGPIGRGKAVAVMAVAAIQKVGKK